LAVYKKQLEDSEEALREFQELYTTQMPVATQLNDQIVIREVELANLLIENTPEHPEVVELKRRIQELKDQRNAELKRFIASAIAKGRDPALYEDLVRTLDDASAQAGAPASADGHRAREAYAAWVTQMDHPLIAAQELTSPQMPLPQANDAAPSNATSFSLAPLQGQELARLNRDYKVNAATYQNLQQRYEQARITQRLGKSDEGLKFRILEPARLPLKPIKPNRLHLFVLSLLLGAVVGVGVAFIAEYMDQSFQSAEDVQAALAVPVLGSISTIVTAQDVEAWRARRRTWCSATHQWQSLKQRVFAPLRAYCGGRLDALLVRWKL
jgi:LPS O-antigen subunit length determinant protein (WzzB/FepE family)